MGMYPAGRAIGRVGALAVGLGIGAAAASVCAAAAHADTGHDSTATRPVTAARHAPATAARSQGTPAVSAAAVRRMPTPSAARAANTTSNSIAKNTAPALTPLEVFGREVQRTFFNRYPTAAPVEISRTSSGVVTGTLGAVDPDGDAMTYTLIAPPSLGRVQIDQSTGTFTYTPVVDIATYGGNDAFTVAVKDTGWHIHGLQELVDGAVDLLRHVPFLGSLFSDYLPVTTTTATVRLTFDGSPAAPAMAFPVGFHWAVSTAGFQSEMGAGAPLDVNSDWWQWTHDPLNNLLLGWKGAVPENGPGAYTQYLSDIALARNEVGADTFRMSIEWSRIFPKSTAGVDVSGGITEAALRQLDALANQTEVAHYGDVLTAMNAAGLDPMVTINHFTLPLWIHDPATARVQELAGCTPQSGGGWVSDSTVTEFEKYSAYLAWKFGPEVTNWVVLNEPVNSMLTSYYAIPFTTDFPPALFRPDLVATGLRNEAAAYSGSYDLIHQYDSDAQVGFALNMYSWRAANPLNPVDQQAAASFSDFYNRWFPDAVIRGAVDANFDGVISGDEINPDLAGKADFFGVNYYSQGIVVGYPGGGDPALPMVTGYPEFSPLVNVIAGGCPAAECSDTAQIIYPAGLRDVLDIANSYRVPMWVTENGLADANDSKRASYLVRHLAVLNKAIADGMDIRGYTLWALTDNLEWVLGYEPKYGLYSYDPVTLQRTPRSSVGLVHNIFTSNSIPASVLRTYLANPRYA